MDVITETSLEALIQRATDPRNKNLDNAAVEAFCGLVKKMPQFSYIATKLVAARIQSDDEWEAVQGLSLLDACMRNCGPCFHCEVGKFRFLNEMIKLVSPKFLGDRTSPKVRDTVLGLLRSWTISYPQEQKIREAYEMLKKQGVVVEPVNNSKRVDVKAIQTSTPSKPNLVLDQEFEKKLQKLLSSKNAQDLEAANKMIKMRVLEAERLTGDIERVRNSIRLLTEMLESRETGESSSEDVQLIVEIYTECEKLRPTVFRLAAETQDSDMLTEILVISEEMQHAFTKYHQTIVKPLNRSKTQRASSSLLDLTSPMDSKARSADQPVKPSNDLLGYSLPASDSSHQDVPKPLDISDIASITPSVSTEVPGNDLDQLGAIFGMMPSASSASATSSSLIPVGRPSNASSAPAEKTSKQKALEELDVLGESLMQQCKLDLENAWVRKNCSDKCNETEPSLFDEDLLQVEDSESDYIPSIEVPDLEFVASTTPFSDRNSFSSMKTVKPLTDVSVTLESIRPSHVPPLPILDSSIGVSIVLHLAKDTPRRDVTVFVVTTTSTSKIALSDYHFQVSVPKGCKFKLQTPSATSLPAHNSFLPPAAITQILLIANPSNMDLTLQFMLSFTMDGETLTELGEFNILPSI